MTDDVTNHEHVHVSSVSSASSVLVMHQGSHSTIVYMYTTLYCAGNSSICQHTESDI